MISADAMSVTTTGGGNAYRELSQLVRERGWVNKRPGRTIAELVFHLTVHLAGVALFVAVPNIWVRIIAFFIMTYGGLGIATNTHTSSHNTTSYSIGVNRFLTYFGYSYLLGLPANYWWNKHCIVHHPAPNVIGVDDDADLMPFFAINQRDYQKARGFVRLFYRVQWVLIPLVLALNAFFSHFQGWKFLLQLMADPKRRRPGHWLDVLALAGYFITWVVVPMFFFSPLHVLGFYVLRNIGMSYAMFVAFAPAHFPAEAVFLDKSQLADDYVLRQTAATVNFRTGFFGRLVCSGVDYQIEHHLFPAIPHVYYPELSREVRAYCERHGYPYRTLGWWEATWKSLVIFYKPKEVFNEVEAFRAPTQPSEAAS